MKRRGETSQAYTSAQKELRLIPREGGYRPVRHLSLRREAIETCNVCSIYRGESRNLTYPLGYTVDTRSKLLCQADAVHIHGRTMTRARASLGKGKQGQTPRNKRGKQKPGGTVPGPGLYCPWAGALKAGCSLQFTLSGGAQRCSLSNGVLAVGEDCRRSAG